MKKFIVCPNCGQKLCKAEPGSNVEMVCPSCKQAVEVTVDHETVIAKGKEWKKVM